MTTPTDARVAVLGLGAMGRALAGAFLTAGHRTAVWNRTPGRAAELAARGALVADSAAGAATAAELVVVCLADHAAVRETLAPLGGALAGRTLVDLTSGSPPDARDTDDWARAHGVDHLSGVIMTTPPGIGTPEVLQLYAGPRPAFDTARPLLTALGEPLYLGADPALPSVYDTALLGLMWGTLTGWLHGAALLGAEGPGGGVTATAFTEVADRWLTTVRAFMRGYAPQVDAAHYPGDGFPLTLHSSTMDILAHASRLRGVAAEFPELLRELTGRAITAGHGEDSYARLVEFIRVP
ncbi:NAD(P)-dependent oxidoreductase [Kitasatospora sp. NPDC006697]|uniref:NAD(P)-dependent oxidoreductase n=1 Tax=Kitasatospora sp. NPDC006697 TaxID=3364020 RepID=UPI0036B0829F